MMVQYDLFSQNYCFTFLSPDFMQEML